MLTVSYVGNHIISKEQKSITMGSAIRRGKAKGRMHYKKHKIAGYLIITSVIILSGCAKTENMSSIEYDKEQEILAFIMLHPLLKRLHIKKQKIVWR